MYHEHKEQCANNIFLNIYHFFVHCSKFIVHRKKGEII